MRAVTDGTGSAVASRRNTYLHENQDYILNGQAAFPAGEGRLIVTGQVKRIDYAEDWTQRSTDPAGTQIENIIAPYDQRDKVGEAGITWQRALGGMEDLSRCRLRSEAGEFPVVGVMPPGFDFPRGVAAWVPRELEPDVARDRPMRG